MFFLADVAWENKHNQFNSIHTPFLAPTHSTPHLCITPTLPTPLPQPPYPTPLIEPCQSCSPPSPYPHSAPFLVSTHPTPFIFPTHPTCMHGYCVYTLHTYMLEGWFLVSDSAWQTSYPPPPSLPGGTIETNSWIERGKRRRMGKPP